MNKLNRKLFIIVFIISTVSCKSRKCQNIPTEFTSYENAKKEIKSRVFNFADSVRIENGTVLKSATYLSCDGKSGYFFHTRINGGEYFVSDVPVRIWENFKSSCQKDTFFTNLIEKRYSSIELLNELE